MVLIRLSAYYVVHSVLQQPYHRKYQQPPSLISLTLLPADPTSSISSYCSLQTRSIVLLIAMSGAEVLAVVGIIANITALVDFGVEVYNRATAFNDGASNIPKAFRSTAQVLPLVKATLQQTEKRIREGDLDIESCQGLTKVLHSCLEALAELNNIFQSVLPKQDASKLTKFRKAISSIRQDKKVEVLEKALRGHIDVLTIYFSSQTLSITQISQAVNSSSERDNSQRKPLFLVRFPKEKDFVGREDVMLEISQRFEQNVPRVAICGIGGVG